MIKDQQRGWAWTRALLGVCAQEVHLCGEASAIDLVKELMLVTGDEVEVCSPPVKLRCSPVTAW